MPTDLYDYFYFDALLNMILDVRIWGSFVYRIIPFEKKVLLAFFFCCDKIIYIRQLVEVVCLG